MNKIKNVMIVDDEESIRYTLGKYLSDAGYTPHQLADPLIAMEKIESQRFSVAIIDRMLANGSSGLELMSYLHEKQPHCQSILISGYPSFESASEAIALKVFAYLAKPVRKNEILAVVEQAAEQFHALQMVNLREQMFARLFEHSPEAIAVYDITGASVFINPAFTRLFGYERVEALGDSVPKIPVNESRKADEDWWNFQKQGVPVEHEVCRLTKGGRRIDVLMSLFPIAGGGGFPAHTMAVYKKPENEEIDSRDCESGKGHEDLAVFKDLAHDLNNLMTIILGNSELCEMYIQGESQAGGFLKNIRNAGQRAWQLADKLQTVSTGRRFVSEDDMG